MDSTERLLKVYNEHHKLVYKESCGLFEKKELLGSGAYGKTYKVKDRNIIKVLKESNIEDPYCELTKNGYSCVFLSETIIHSILSKRDPKHFPIIYGYAVCGDKIQTLMEKMEYTLDYFIENFEKIMNRSITDTDYKFIINEVLKGIKAMHQLRISHNDLKLDNIMIKKENGKIIVKIIDFGLSNKYSLPILEAYYHEEAGIETWKPSYDPYFFLFNIHKELSNGQLKDKVCGILTVMIKASKDGKKINVMDCNHVYSDYNHNYSRPSVNYQSNVGINEVIKMFNKS